MIHADIDGSGYIDYSGNYFILEFLAAAQMIQNLLSKEKVELAFNMLDSDKSGSISLDELKNAFGKRNVEHDPLIE